MRRRLNTQWQLPVLLVVVTLLPRLWFLGADILGEDNYSWLYRGQKFVSVLDERDFAGTFIKYHPGVTVMWLSGLGIKVFRTVYGLLNGNYNVCQFGQYPCEAFSWLYFSAKMPLVAVFTGCVVFSFFLLTKLLNRELAFLSMLIFSLEPFVIGHSRELHLDALLTIFSWLAVLNLLVFIREEKRDWKFYLWLVVSAVFAGFALLTKVTALFLVPYVALVLFTQVIRSSSNRNNRQRRRAGPLARVPLWGKQLINYTAFFSVWVFIALLTFTILFPSMWVRPLDTVQKIYTGITYSASGDTAGAALFNIRPFYYLGTLLRRVNPAALLLSVLGLFTFLFAKKESNYFRYPILLAIFVFWFLVFMAIPNKKFDRYALPLFPYLAVFSAFGLVAVFKSVKNHLLKCVSAVLLFSFSLLGMVAYSPQYTIFYSSPLVNVIGNVEIGYDRCQTAVYKSAAFINDLGAGTDFVLASCNKKFIEPFVNHGVVHLKEGELPDADYYLLSAGEYPNLHLVGNVRIGREVWEHVYEKN